MSNTNDFLVFASTDTGTNLIEQAAWVSSSQRLIGNVPGVASSAFNNKAIRQSAYVVSQIAQYISNALAQDVLDNATPSALLAQIQNALGTPAGVIQAYGNATPPTGWLNCDGSTVSQTTYAVLYAAIGTTYNYGGEASGTFRLPDLRGIFPRGSGTNGHVACANGSYPSAALGAYQNDEMQGHEHNTTSGGLNLMYYVGTGGIGATSAGTNFQADGAKVTSTPISDGTNGAPRTGVETRPFNIGVNYIIRT